MNTANVAHTRYRGTYSFTDPVGAHDAAQKQVADTICIRVVALVREKSVLGDHSLDHFHNASMKVWLDLFGNTGPVGGSWFSRSWPPDDGL